MFEVGPREPRREIVRGMLVFGDGFVGGWRAYGGGGAGEVVLGWRGWLWKDDGKRFGRRWIRAESIGLCVFFGCFVDLWVGRLAYWVVKIVVVVVVMTGIMFGIDDASVGNGGGS